MNYGEQLLSKIIDQNDPSAFVRFNVTESDFPTEAERKAYRFIRDYAEQNRGQAPSYAVFVAENPDVTYIPGVTDSYEYLVRELKKSAAKREIVEFFESGEISKKFYELDVISFAEWLKKKAEDVIIGTNVRQNIGTNVKTDTAKFLEEYEKRKEGRSFRIWKSKFPSINREIGGYLSGNMYTWYGRSGRGKSVFVMEEALEAAMQGANVLVWAMEMSWFEWVARSYASISAREGIAQAEINGEVFAAGFDNRAMLMGKLPSDFEEVLRKWLAGINEKIPGNIILRAADDPDFENRSLKALESDILETKADVVVLDPFYYVDYERNTSNKTGGDAEITSKKLRRLVGRLGVVAHVITQADEVKEKRDDEGSRELNPPQRAEIKKTKAVLEDATNVFGIDSVAKEGRGIIVIGKGRNGGEDTVVETLYLPNYGIVREMETGEIAARQFETVF